MADGLFTWWCDGIVTMVLGTGRTDGDEDSECDRDITDPTTGTSLGNLSRRQSLSALGTGALLLTSGCLTSLRTLGSSRIKVGSEEPSDNPAGTPEEFHFWLEDHDISVDELYHDTEENSLVLFYNSTAETKQESIDEIWVIYMIYRDGVIDNGSDITHLYAEVRDRFDGQVEGWNVDSEWAKMDLEGERTKREIWRTIAKTRLGGDYGTDSTRNGTENQSSVEERQNDE